MSLVIQNQKININISLKINENQPLNEDTTPEKWNTFCESRIDRLLIPIFLDTIKLFNFISQLYNVNDKEKNLKRIIFPDVAFQDITTDLTVMKHTIDDILIRFFRLSINV